MFLRGHGEQTFIQDNGTLAAYKNTTTLRKSGTLGKIQGDAIRNIIGRWASKPMSWMFGSFSSGAVTGELWGEGAYHAGGWAEEFQLFDASRVVSTANENRPINQAVRYLIKAVK